MDSIAIMRVVAKLFYVFPVKRNRVVLTAYNGKRYSCNPKYITEKLDKNSYEVCYALSDETTDSLPDGVKKLRYRSLRHLYHLMTAHYVIINSTGFSLFLPYRENQRLINTWHGGVDYKTTGISHFKDECSVKKRIISGNNTDYFLSSSRVSGEQQSHSMCVLPEKLLNIGLPRNDIFFEDHPEIIKKIKDEFKIKDNYGIILYAPTYRDGPVRAMSDYSMIPIDIEAIIKACEQRFKKSFVFLFKAHHDMLTQDMGDNCIDASSHSDIQELLYSADILITDYSSCMWDFALTHSAGFLYMPDVDEYQKVHSFASPVESWPFPSAVSNSEMVALIQNYDETVSRNRISTYFEHMGCFENGHATDALINLMDSLMICN